MRTPPWWISFVFLLLAVGCRRVNLVSPDRVAYKDTVFTEYFRRTTGWIAGDGAYSIPLSTGQSLWTFGDSYLDSYNPTTQMVPCLFQVRNACLLMGIDQPGVQHTLPGNGGSNTYFVHGSALGSFIWPGTGFQHGDTVCVFVTKYWETSEDTSFIAQLLLPDLTLHGYTQRPDRDGIEFSNAVVQGGDGFTYIYGTRNNGFGNDLFVGRYPEGNIYADWEYHGRNGWDGDISKIERVWDEFTSSFYVVKVEGKYILITTEFSVGCDQGYHIYAASSRHPQGPFLNQHVIWELDDTLEGHYPFFYLANAHPEYDNGKDELLITYSINTYEGCVVTCFNGRMYPDVYRPKAIRVPYELLTVE